ncbi:hypothetical protein [Pseudosulfitobacter pseudonitzschiae]|uniref:hypothetical protein n=1 Tax=Pseudosulfitobacter pseudonitzschiae TaxID=1402135 RepID=UPI003B7627ED
MRILQILAGATLASLSAMAALAEDECGRWVQCPEDVTLSRGEYRSYIYGNSSDVEPWSIQDRISLRGRSTLMGVAPEAAELGTGTGASEVRQIQALERDPQTGLFPGDVSLEQMDVGQLILEAAPELTPDQIAQGIAAAELYLKSINYRESDRPETEISFDGLSKNTGTESGMDGVTIVKPY